MNKRNSETQADLKELSSQCLEHLKKEADSLRGFLEHALAVQESVINGEAGDEAALTQKQTLLEQESATILLARNALHDKIGQAVGEKVPTVTVKELAAHVEPKIAEQLLQHREIIIDLSKSIETANRTNSMLFRQTLDLQRRWEVAITGQVPSAQTYGASGQLNRAPDSTLIQTEC